MHTHTPTHAYSHAYSHGYAHAHSHAYTRTHTRTHTRTQTPTHTSTHAHAHSHTYAHAYTHANALSRGRPRVSSAERPGRRSIARRSSTVAASRLRLISRESPRRSPTGLVWFCFFPLNVCTFAHARGFRPSGFFNSPKLGYSRQL